MALQQAQFRRASRHFGAIVSLGTAACLLFLFLPLRDTKLLAPPIAYDEDRQVFLHGDLEKSQFASERDYRRFIRTDPDWAFKFRILEAETMLWRGMYSQALMAAETGHSGSPEFEVRRLSIESVALVKLQRFPDANGSLRIAEQICHSQSNDSCGDVLRARGIFDVEQTKYEEGRKIFLSTLDFARSHNNPFLEASANLNLGWTASQIEHFDEAVDWLRSAHRIASDFHAEDLVQRAVGDLGWAFLGLGDTQQALDLFLEAEKRAIAAGDLHFRLNWVMTAGAVYQQTGDLPHAFRSFELGLDLARQINNKPDVVNALEVLAHASIDAGRLDEANSCIQQLVTLLPFNGNRLDELDVLFAQARIAAIQHRDHDAERMLQTIFVDGDSQTSMRLGAQHELARLYESEGKVATADQEYRASLATFESARSQLKNEDSKLPFLANAASTYDDYIHFLVAHGRSDDALRIADQSRAQTLAQGLGITGNSKRGEDHALRPGKIAEKSKATLLFYWLGDKQSYLWAITANKTALFPLPPHREIVQTIERYRKTLLGFTDPAEKADADGLALYRMLVAPASSLIPSGGNVVILCDGELSQINFETLIVPAQRPHYWIEDATLVSASSLHLLAAHAAESSGRKLLLFGDAISPNPDYPNLPMAAKEIKQIEQNFALQDQTIYAREKATAPAYLEANPQQFAYIHFVAHGVASRTDPLDSAIILSRANAAEDSFKLHAREIIQHPLHARLVTIAACYGSGARSYSGEGPVGLAWAFLRAGGHNVIGALWEASDESTARLMGDLYRGLQGGMSPAAALRSAKLDLLHSQREFRKPFYWAPFQVYSGL